MSQICQKIIVKICEAKFQLLNKQPNYHPTLTEGGNFLLHRIVAVDPMTAWQDLQIILTPKLVHLGDPNHLPYPVRADAGGKAEHGGQRLRHEGTGQAVLCAGGGEEEG